MAGKGSKPRSCFSADYKNNYDEIFGKRNLQIVPVYRVGYRVTGEKKTSYAFLRDCTSEQDAVKKFLTFNDEKTHTVMSCELFST
jgi:hypothetical protein